MKIRHFGLPARPLLQTEPGAQAEGAAKTTQLSKDADVQIQGGALAFPRGAAELSKKARTERARVLLETLRADEGGGFGGRVKGGVDVAASLKSYFRSLEVAELAAHKGGGEAVEAFVAGLDVPEDIRPLLGLVIDGAQAPKPLGKLAEFDNDPNYNRIWAEWQQGNKRVHTVADETVRRWFSAWGTGNDGASFIGYGDADFKLGVVKFWARAKELGQPSTFGNLPAYFGQLPQTPEAAKVLLRFAAAYGLDPNGYQFAGKALSEWGRAAPPRVSGHPIGKEAQFRNNPGAWQQAVARGDAAATKIDDATIRFFAEQGYLTDAHSTVYNAPAGVKDGLILVFARAAELGLPNTSRDHNALQNLATYTPASAAAAKALSRFGRATGIDVNAMQMGGQPVSSWLGVKQPPPSGVGVGRAGRPLGTVATWQNDSNYNALYATAQGQPLQARKVTDATLQKWFGDWGPNRELTAYYSEGTPDTRLTYVLWWARGKEIGLPATCNVGALQNIASYMPATADAANALRRLGRAFGFDVEHMLLGGSSPVSGFPRARASADASLPKRAALGDTRMTAAQLEKAIEKLDEKIGTLDDASLKRLLEANPDPAALLNKNNDRNWQLAILDLLERGAALGAVDPSVVQLAMRSVSSRNLDDETIAARLASLAARAGLGASSVTLASGLSLADHASTKPHVQKLERALAGAAAALSPRRAARLDDEGSLSAAGPLGNLPGPHSNYWAHDPRMFEISDDGIRNEMMSWGDFSWMSSWNNHPGVISLIARIAELNTAQGNPSSGAANNIKSWLAQPVPEIFGTEDALPRVLRAARAGGVDPANVRVMRGGQPIPLLEHPALAAMLDGSAADQKERADALAADLAILSPNANTHPAEREGAVLRLLAVTDPEHEIVHQLDELLPAILAGLNDKSIARIDLSKVPAKHKAKLLDAAFARDEHPAQIALLAGALFQTDAASIEALLLKKGHLPAVAKEMSEAAATLMTKGAADLAYVSLGASKDPPELASLGWRVSMLGAPTPASILAQLRKGDVDTEEVCTAVLERAVQSSPERRDALLAMVQKAIDEELVGKDSLIAGLQDEVKARLDATAIERAEAAVLTFLDATPAQAAAARAALASALGSATWLDDPNIVAAAALKAALAHDLKHVAPLGEVDEAAAGITGKPWQSRLAGQGKTVGVGGIQIPVEGRGQDLALPLADAGTGKKNLQSLATRWLARRPVSVVGADAADMIAALARATGAKLERVTVTAATSAHELLGPDGAVARALAIGGVVHLELDGASWPDGLGAALMNAAQKARIVATGPALPGVPALALMPLDEASVLAHLRGLGLSDEDDKVGDLARMLAQAFVQVRGVARAGETGPLTDASFTLPLLDRVIARLGIGGAAPADDAAHAALHEALTDLFARRVPADAREAVQQLIDGIVPAPAATEPLLAIDGKVAVIDELKLAVVGTPADLASLPALTSGEHAQLKASARALELGEPVVADAELAERLGTLYGALTGRDVHVHLLHKDSKPEDVIGAGSKDVVVVLHDFSAAPEATQDALWQAAAQGKVRLVVGDRDGSISADGLVLRADAVSAEEHAERLVLRARALGLPEAVAEGVRAFKDELDALISRGEVAPLVDVTSAQDLDSALELCAQLSGAMPTVDAFVAAMSATWPMSTPEQQELLEAAARKVADA